MGPETRPVTGHSIRSRARRNLIAPGAIWDRGRGGRRERRTLSRRLVAV